MVYYSANKWTFIYRKVWKNVFYSIILIERSSYKFR